MLKWIVLAVFAVLIVAFVGWFVLKNLSSAHRWARDLLNALAVRGALPSRYAILEPSPDLRERQRETIARAAGAALQHGYAGHIVERIETGIALTGAGSFAVVDSVDAAGELVRCSRTTGARAGWRFFTGADGTGVTVRVSTPTDG